MKKLLTMALACLLATGTMNINATYVASKDEVTNWVNEKGTWYVLDEENNKRTGWYKDEKLCWFYLDYKTGAMKTGWAADGKDWYYMNPANGIMQTGWQTIDGVRYYFIKTGKKAGSMATGTIEIDGIKYNFGTNGALIGQSNKGEPRNSGYKKMDDLLDDILSKIITDGMTEREELKAIHDYVAKNTTYEQILGLGDYLGKRADGKKDIPAYDKFNRSANFYNYAYRTLSEGRGVCDHYVIAFNALADRLGYRTTSTGGRYDSNGHMVSMVWLDGEWLIVDVQADDWKDDGSIFDFGFLKTYKEYNTHFWAACEKFFKWNDSQTILEQAIRWNWEQKEDKDFKSVEEMIEFFGGY